MNRTDYMVIVLLCLLGMKIGFDFGRWSARPLEPTLQQPIKIIPKPKPAQEYIDC